MAASANRRRILALWLPRLPTDRLTATHADRCSECAAGDQPGSANNALYVYALEARAQTAGTLQGPASGQCPRHGAAAQPSCPPTKRPMRRCWKGSPTGATASRRWSALDAPDGLFLGHHRRGASVRRRGGDAGNWSRGKIASPGLCRAGRHCRHLPGGACAGALRAGHDRAARRRSAGCWRRCPSRRWSATTRSLRALQPRRPQDHRRRWRSRAAQRIVGSRWARALSPGWR